MRKKSKDYIILIGVFLLIIFSSHINGFLSNINPNLKQDKIEKNYDTNLEKEYRSLKEYNDIKEESDLNLIISKVKYRNVYEFSNTITIFKGFKDHINVGSAILTNDGLVGVVTKTFERYSIGSLITSKSSNISVSINDSVGILKMQKNELVVTDINNYENINVGDAIYTSGLGNLPKNIFVGTVEKINLNKTQIEKIVKVKIGANLNELNYLFVYGDYK